MKEFYDLGTNFSFLLCTTLFVYDIFIYLDSYKSSNPVVLSVWYANVTDRITIFVEFVFLIFLSTHDCGETIQTKPFAFQLKFTLNIQNFSKIHFFDH